MRTCIVPRLQKPVSPCSHDTSGPGLTAAPCMGVHIGRVFCYPLETPGVAALSDSCQPRLDLLHAHFHVDDCFGRIEEVAVTPAAIQLAASLICLVSSRTQRATVASRDCRRHCCGAAVPAFAPPVSGIEMRPPTIGRFVGRALPSPWPVRVRAGWMAKLEKARSYATVRQRPTHHLA